MSFRVRLSEPKDFKEIDKFDEFWGDRRQEIQRGELFVCSKTDFEIVGFIVLTRSGFFDYPFISYVCVKEGKRNQGAAKFMLEFIDKYIFSVKHFTSTEVDNVEARALFEKAGYIIAGELSHLDEEKEVIYVKLNNKG
ncbi:GNAT family N-acetyltransferase [Shewanella sp. 10N.286.48.B5]|uniref:GNAT family N-acetyltransferase n=1 Tax=Shewanella sp. 10N.286.48.B5 TaxID=1880834 RepID=UPI000C856A83|nr:GNAT family N-acetyltransferase [Shewanella sp. 10N.286.48.B5]PMH88751.1 hypothetical protein BCU57_03605 [Shewanella sp. 10N.286.48.B5]